MRLILVTICTTELAKRNIISRKASVGKVASSLWAFCYSSRLVGDGWETFYKAQWHAAPRATSQSEPPRRCVSLPQKKRNALHSSMFLQQEANAYVSWVLNADPWMVLREMYASTCNTSQVGPQSSSADGWHIYD